MAKYDGLIIPRSYSEYINKTDGATLSQALQNSGVMDTTPTENSVKPVKSGGIYDALSGKQPTLTFDNTPTEDSSNPVTSGGIFDALGGKKIKVIKDRYTINNGFITINPGLTDNNYIPIITVGYGGDVGLNVMLATQPYTGTACYVYVRNHDGTVPADGTTIFLLGLILY